MKNLYYLLLAICIACVLAISCEKTAKIAAELSVNTEELLFPATADTQVITITSSVDWIIEYEEDWINVDTEYGEAGEDIPVNISVSAFSGGTEDRTGIITISAGKSQHLISVTQSLVGIIVSVESLAFKDEVAGANKTITVTSTVRWTSTADSWLTLDPKQAKAGKTKVKVTASMNAEEGERSGTITFNAGGATGAYKTITATQEKVQNRFKVYDASIPDYYDENKKILNSISLADKGNIRKIKVVASSTWTATSIDSWVKISPSTGTAGITKVNISADENSTTAERHSEITVNMNGAPAPIAIPLTQGKAGNYYDNGDYLQIHTATKGTGVSIVLIGDGFDREDLKKGGWWETKARELAEYFLTSPIVTDFNDYFNVYIYMAESQERGVLAGTKNIFGSGGSQDFDKSVRLSGDIPGIKPVRSTIFVGNGMIGGYAWFHLRMGVYSTDEGPSYYWMSHEFIGHAFGGLADEYVSSCDYMGGPNSLKGSEYHNAGNGNCLNVTWTQDTTLYYKNDGSTTHIKSESNGNPCVPWKPFIGRPGYEKVGLFQGGFYCPTDIWKPEDFSVMVGWSNLGAYYNAQSRWLIYKTIMTEGEVPKTNDELFEDFIIYDQKHIN